MSTRDVWERRVARWAKSGLSRGEFANRVKATTLGWWRWALRTTAPRASNALVKSDVAFIEVEALSTDARIEVALANGRVVRVASPFNDQELGRVLAIAERVFPGGLRIFVAVEPIDMRCSIDGLVAAVATRLKQDAAVERALYVFANARGDRAKMVWRNKNCWSLLYTRFDVGLRVLLPEGKGAASVTVDGRTLAAILDGVKKRPTAREVVKEARTRLQISSPMPRASIVVLEVVRTKYKAPDATAPSASVDASVTPPHGAPLGRAPLAERIVIAEMPDRAIPRAMAEPGLLAHILVSKFSDHIPLHRQEAIFRREGFRIARSTLGEWVQASTTLLGHVFDAMWKNAKENASYSIVDATGVLVRAKDECKRAHFYVVVVPKEHVLFRFTRTNDGPTVASLLADFKGFIHADASNV